MWAIPRKPNRSGGQNQKRMLKKWNIFNFLPREPLIITNRTFLLLHKCKGSNSGNNPCLPDWMSHILPSESGSKSLEKSSGLPMSSGLDWGRTKPADKDKAANQPRSINPTSANGLGTIPAPKYVILHNNVYFSLITLELQEQIKKKHQIYLHRADLSIYSKSLQNAMLNLTILWITRKLHQTDLLCMAGWNLSEANNIS